MAARPTLVTDADAAPSSRRKQDAGSSGAVQRKAEQSVERKVTVHYDVAGIVRWTFFGLTSVLVGLSFVIVAWNGGTNYPTTASINAISAAFSAAGSDGDKTKQ